MHIVRYSCAYNSMGDPKGCTNLFTNLLPDDSGHLISVEFDYRVCHGNFRLWEP